VPIIRFRRPKPAVRISNEAAGTIGSQAILAVNADLPTGCSASVTDDVVLPRLGRARAWGSLHHCTPVVFFMTRERAKKGCSALLKFPSNLARPFAPDVVAPMDPCLEDVHSRHAGNEGAE
jgi:hypothetical protein